MFEKAYSKVESFATAISTRKYWRWYLAIFCSIYCIVTNIPTYKTLLDGNPRNPAIWNRINRQIDNPLAKDNSNMAWEHEAKLTFRITPPMIGKLVPSSNIKYRLGSLFLLQNIAGVIFFYLLIIFAEVNLNDKLSRMLLPLCFAMLYNGKTFFSDMAFFFDGLGYLFLLIAVSTRNPILIFGSLFLAYYTDERCIIGSGFVFLYHFVANKDLRPNYRAIVGIIIAVLAYGVTRYYLQSVLGMSTPKEGTGILTVFSNMKVSNILLGQFTAFKGCWLFLIIGMFYFKNKLHKLLYISVLIVIITGGMYVFDFSRTVAYGFVGLLLSLHQIYKNENATSAVNKLLLIVLFFNFINPLYDVHGEELFLSRSVIARFIEASVLKLPS